MGRGDSGKGPEGRGVRVAQGLLFQHGIIRFRSPRTHRSWYQVRSKHRYLRSGLLRGLGTRWLQHQSTPQTEKYDWTQPSRHARRGARSTFPRRRERSELSLRNSIHFSFYFLFLLRSLSVYSRLLRRFPTTLVRLIEVGSNESTKLFAL